MYVLEKLYNLTEYIMAFAFIIGIPSVMCFNFFRKKKLPPNNYTPYDDMLEGRTPRSRSEYRSNTANQAIYRDKDS